MRTVIVNYKKSKIVFHKAAYYDQFCTCCIPMIYQPVKRLYLVLLLMTLSLLQIVTALKNQLRNYNLPLTKSILGLKDGV